MSQENCDGNSESPATMEGFTKLSKAGMWICRVAAYLNDSVEQTPRKVCLKWKAPGGAAHAGRYTSLKRFKEGAIEI
jgi:hypothetical protein